MSERPSPQREASVQPELPPRKATSPPKFTVHKDFPEKDGTDITVISSDGVTFHLHRKYLEATTGSFPGTEVETADIPVHLSDPSNVLEILFQFARPQKQPDLTQLGFEVLAPLAEAANKYQVFAAMPMCEMRMKTFISSHPRELLFHGFKHDYPQFVEKAAHKLCRAPLLSVVDYLPVHCLTPWIEYQEAYKTVLKEATKSWIKDAVRASKICKDCHSAMIIWATELAEIDNIEALEKEIMRPNIYLCYKPSSVRKFENDSGTSRTGISLCSSANAEGFEDMRRVIQERIKAIPPFVSFVQKRRKKNSEIN